MVRQLVYVDRALEGRRSARYVGVRAFGRSCETLVCGLGQS